VNADGPPVWLLRDARLGLTGQLVDLLIEDGIITRLVGRSRGAGPGQLAPSVGADRTPQIVELDGRTVIPGLWDHHVHFDQWSLTSPWVDLAGAAGPSDVVALVRRRLASGAPEPDLPLVGYGYRDGLWAEPPHRSHLDAVSTDIPLVMASGDLHQAWLNTAALRRYGFPPDGVGIVREDAWYPVMDDIRRVPDSVLDGWVARAAAAAAARGVVGVVDFESGDNLTSWPRRCAATAPRLRVRAAVWPDRLEAAIARGLRTGDPLPGTGGTVTMGPLKVITDGSLNTRTAYCVDPYPGLEGTGRSHGVLIVPPVDLVPLMRRAWSNGIETAIHAIGDLATTLVLDAFEEVGASGAVEHAQLLSHADLPRFARLQVAASIQPEHALDDRDVADRYWAGRTGRSFPYRDLQLAGARLALGSDAPVAPLDPWISLAAAVSRSRDGREPWHPEQELDLATALAASTAVRRTEPRPDDVADLVVTELDLTTANPEDLRTAAVAGTMLGGEWTWRQGI
jgi:predicted amidohydrolase YtcJ